MADYCVYWLRRAHDELPPCTADDPVTGRAGLVGTQNIRNNASRVGGLDPICADGTIIEAVDNQPWSGEANVHVSIANWVKTQDASLLPRARRLWFKSAQSSAKVFDLDCREVPHINSALSDQADVATAHVLSCNRSNGAACQGITPGHAGFVLSNQERLAIINMDAASSAVIHPYMIGDDLLSGDSRSSRYIIDFGQQDMLSVQAFPGAFRHLQRTVLPDMQKHADDNKSERANSLEQWWLHWRPRTELMTAIAGLPRYLACSRVTKRPIFAFINASVRPGDALQVFSFSDDYSFGILQSSVHWHWFVAKCSKLTERFRYTPESVFDTFPWPQSPTVAQIDAIAKAGREIRRIRTEALTSLKGGLRALYRTFDLPGKNPLRDAHIALDRAVLAAYGFSFRRDLLQQLLDLNYVVASRIQHLQPVIVPGIPSCYRKPALLVTTDCIGG